jgi:hypothetical protein
MFLQLGFDLNFVLWMDEGFPGGNMRSEFVRLISQHSQPARAKVTISRD